LMVAFVTLAFAIIKLEQLATFHNPQVNENTIADYYEPEETLELFGENSSTEFMIAVAVESYFTKKSLIDSRYLKWAAYIWKENSDETSFFELAMRPCSDEDFKKFYPVEKKSELRLNGLK